MSSTKGTNHRTIPINSIKYEKTLRAFCRGKCKKSLSDIVKAIPGMNKDRMKGDIVAMSISVNRKIILERAGVDTSGFILDVE